MPTAHRTHPPDSYSPPALGFSHYRRRALWRNPTISFESEKRLPVEAERSRTASSGTGGTACGGARRASSGDESTREDRGFLAPRSRSSAEVSAEIRASLTRTPRKTPERFFSTAKGQRKAKLLRKDAYDVFLADTADLAPDCCDDFFLQRGDEA